MNLQELVAEHSHRDSEPSLVSSYIWASVYGWARNEDRTEPLVASLLWQIYLTSGAYAASLAKAYPGLDRLRDTIIVPAESRANSRFVCVQFCEDEDVEEPTPVELLLPTVDQLSSAVRAWRELVREAGERSSRREGDLPGDAASGAEGNRGVEGLLDSFGEEQVPDLLRLMAGNLDALLVPQPRIELTAVPSTPIGVRPCRASRDTATVGVVATTRDGISGVTTALHALEGAAGVPVAPGQTACTIAGVPCTVISCDTVSDSCFVELDPSAWAGSGTRPAIPLSGLTPRLPETVSAYGLTTPAMQGNVTGWDPAVPIVFPRAQLKVYTTPMTAPGDSGAALLDSSGHVLGFAFYRTGIGEPIEYSAWIWADSVYQAHHLAPKP